jgi:hypothetical protein
MGLPCLLAMPLGQLCISWPRRGRPMCGFNSPLRTDSITLSARYPGNLRHELDCGLSDGGAFESGDQLHRVVEFLVKVNTSAVLNRVTFVRRWAGENGEHH